MNYIKEQLALTLFDLIKTREFSDISISELVNKAGVGRASFYRKYTCKEDVLSQYIIEKLEQWKKDFDANPSGDFVVSLFNYFYENKELYLLLYKANLSNLLYEGIRIASGINSPPDNISTYRVATFAGILFGVADEWMRRGMIETPEELHSILNMKWYKR